MIFRLFMGFFCLMTSVLADEKRDLIAACLLESYPQIKSIEENTIAFENGQYQILDDGRQKTLNQKIIDPDVEDMFSMLYPIGDTFPLPIDPIQNPGRIRNTDFFKHLYGEGKTSIERNLVKMPWNPEHNQTFRITRINGVDKRLEQIIAAFDTLPEALKKYVARTSGGFNWRSIAGTKRLSMHSFGIAIDIDAKYSDYWRWNRTKESDQILYQNKIPMEIVSLFEAQGFIWGGKWYHYDTMHFEYRPALLCVSKQRQDFIHLL